MLLLWLVRWLKQHSQISPVVLLMRDGPLRQEFEAVCPTHFWQPPPPYRPWLPRLLDRFDKTRNSSAATLLANTIMSCEPDVVYLNTLVLGRYLNDLGERARDRVFVSHCHELFYTLATMSSPDDVRAQLGLSSAVISCASVVQELLLERYGLEGGKGVVVPEFLPVSTYEQITRQQPMDSQTDKVQQQLKRAKNDGTFIFGCVGSAISRKGFDLFPLLLKECVSIFGDLPFLGVWLGCGEQSEARMLAEIDLDRLGLKQHVLLLPGLPSGVPVISQFDVHCLLSREDPYPVVVLEAAAVGVPTICFLGSGGIPEFVADDHGLSVAYLDLPAYARALFDLAIHPERRSQLGVRCQDRVFRQSSIDVAAPMIVSTLQQVMEGRSHG